MPTLLRNDFLIARPSRQRQGLSYKDPAHCTPVPTLSPRSRCCAVLQLVSDGCLARGPTVVNMSEGVDLADFIWNLTQNRSFDGLFIENYFNLTGGGVGNEGFGTIIGNVSSAAGDPSSPTEYNDADLPWWASTIWSIVFGALISTAVGGNLIVIWIVLGIGPFLYKKKTLFSVLVK